MAGHEPVATSVAVRFLERQESARRRTRIYVLQLWLLAIPCVASMLVATLFSVWLTATAILAQLLGIFVNKDEAIAALLHPAVFVVSLILYTAIVFGYLVASKRRQLGRSGEYVAEQLNAAPAGRSSRDLHARRLYNIAEEMALAAGIPAPSVYVWPARSAINALAVGHNNADAALFVSRGAVDALTRDEMQALVGYGMSQILNGDMALNARLAAYIHAFQFAPRVAKSWLFLPKGQQGVEFFKAVICWLFIALWVGIALSIISFPQYLAARLLQASIGRERQKLADASMLQFTRNPESVRNLLAKSLAFGVAPISPPRVLDDLAHACFASPVKRRYFDTHLRLEKRIAALDPSFDFSTIPALGQRIWSDIQNRQRAAVATSPGADAEGAPGDARMKLLALLLDNRPDVRARQVEAVRQRMPEVADAISPAASLVPGERTLLLDAHLPALRALPARELQRLALVIMDIEAADGRIDVFGFAVSRYAAVFVKDLLKPRAPHGNDTLPGHASDLATLLTVVAQHGGEQHAAAYEAGMQRVGLPSWPRFEVLAQWAQPLDGALSRLEKLRPIAKEKVLEALSVTVKYDHEETPAERELVRAIAALLHCPLPRPAGLAETPCRQAAS